MEAVRESDQLNEDVFKRLVKKACGPEARKFRALDQLQKGEKRTWFIFDKTSGVHYRIEGTVVHFEDAGASVDVGDFGMPIRDPVFDFTIFHSDGTNESLKNARIDDEKTFNVKVFLEPTQADWDARSRRIENMSDDEDDEELVAMTIPFPKGTLVATRMFMPGGLKRNVMIAYDGVIEERVAFRNLPKSQHPSEEIRQMADALCLSLRVNAGGKGNGRAVQTLRTIVERKVQSTLTR